MLRLKELRAKFNMTQKDLAERLEMSQQAIAKWEKGIAEPTVKNLRELAIIFGISVDDLLGNSKIIKTTHLCDYGPKKKEDIKIDGFWGNLGIKVKGQKNPDGIQLHRESMKICIWLFRMTQNGSMLKL